MFKLLGGGAGGDLGLRKAENTDPESWILDSLGIALRPSMKQLNCCPHSISPSCPKTKRRNHQLPYKVKIHPCTLLPRSTSLHTLSKRWRLLIELDLFVNPSCSADYNHLQGMLILPTALTPNARERHWLLPHQPGPSRLQLSCCLPASAPTPLPPLSGHSPTFPEDFSLGLQIAFPFFPLHAILSNFTGCDGASGILTLQLLPTSWWPSSLLPISTWSYGLHPLRSAL